MITLEKITEKDLDTLCNALRHHKQVLSNMVQTIETRKNTSIASNLQRQIIKKALKINTSNRVVMQFQDHQGLVLLEAIQNYIPFAKEDENTSLNNAFSHLNSQLAPYETVS